MRIISLGKKHSNKFIKGHDGVTVEDGEIQRKSSDVDDLTVSTLGIDGLEEDRGGDNSEDIGP